MNAGASECPRVYSPVRRPDDVVEVALVDRKARETRLDGPLCDLAQSVARDLTERYGTGRVSAAFGCESASIRCWH